MLLKSTKVALVLTRTDAAFGGWCEASGGRLAPLAYNPRSSLRSPSPKKSSKNRKNISKEIFLSKKKSEDPKKSERNLKKKFVKTFSNFFFRFSNFFFRRNLSYDEYITHAKFSDHRSRGSGDTRGDRHTHGQIILVI